MKHKLTLTAAALAVVGMTHAKPAEAADCGTAQTVTIAEMTWLSSATLAHVAQRIMADGYGCNAQLVPGDTVPTATSMLTRSQPDVAPEFWVSTAQTIWDQIEEKGNVYKASDIFADGGIEGWWIPDYLAEAHPEIKSVEDLKANWEVFAEQANPDQGRMYGCPPGWGCEIITNNLFKALGMGVTYELFSPGSGENLKASIGRAVTRKKPIVAYYWGPSDVIGKYNLVRLDMPAYEADKFVCLTDSNCADPQLTGWAVGEVAVAVVSSLKERAPDVAEFLGHMQVPNKEFSAILGHAEENRLTPQEAAEYILKSYDAIWSAWVPADVAERVRAKL